MAANGEAEPCAAITARHRSIALTELLKEARQHIGGNTATGVAHTQNDGLAVARRAQCDRTLRRELDGVRDEVAGDLTNARLVTLNHLRQIARKDAVERKALRPRRGRPQLRDRRQRLMQIERLALDLQ